MAAAVTNFIAKAPSSKELLKSATLIRTLGVNTFIEGEIGVGKSALASIIAPDALFVSPESWERLGPVESVQNGILVEDFDILAHDPKFLKWIEEAKPQITATSRKAPRVEIFDRFFSIHLFIKPLLEREEDVKALAQLFLQEAKEFLGKGISCDIAPPRLILDLKENAHSLRRSVYFTFLMNTIGESEIMSIMEHYLLGKIGGNNDYRDFLYLYEAPLINASLKKYKSQLRVARTLGLNRNTLRKKIDELRGIG